MTRRQVITWWSMGGVLLLFAVTGLAGALMHAGKRQNPWHITVISAAVTPDRPPLQRTDQAGRWVAVTAKVEITGDTSQADLVSMVQLSGVDGLIGLKPNVILLRDNTQIDLLHPGLPEDVAFVWEQKGSSTAPVQVTVVVPGSAPVTMAVKTS